MADYTVAADRRHRGRSSAARFKRARSALGDHRRSGMQVIDLPPNGDAYPEHDHASDGQEEVYATLRGSGEIEIDGERHPLDADHLVSVKAGTMRKVFSGPDGLRLLDRSAASPGAAYEVHGVHRGRRARPVRRLSLSSANRSSARGRSSACAPGPSSSVTWRARPRRTHRRARARPCRARGRRRRRPGRRSRSTSRAARGPRRRGARASPRAAAGRRRRSRPRSARGARRGRTSRRSRSPARAAGAIAARSARALASGSTRQRDEPVRRRRRSRRRRRRSRRRSRGACGRSARRARRARSRRSGRARPGPRAGPCRAPRR